MSHNRPRVRRSRGRVVLGVGLTAAVLGCGGVFIYGQVNGTSPRADANDQTVDGPTGSTQVTSPVEATPLPEMNSEFTRELAQVFGVEPYQLRSAVNSVRAGQVHYGRSTDETAAGRHRALADALGLDPGNINGTAATSGSGEQTSERFVDLLECLDEAVEDGDLNEFDRDIVLKVHQLGLLEAVE